MLAALARLREVHFAVLFCDGVRARACVSLFLAKGEFAGDSPKAAFSDSYPLCACLCASSSSFAVRTPPYKYISRFPPVIGVCVGRRCSPSSPSSRLSPSYRAYDRSTSYLNNYGLVGGPRVRMQVRPSPPPQNSASAFFPPDTFLR